MRIRNSVNNVLKKTLKIRRKVSATLKGYTPIRKLVADNRALIPVVSSLILIAVVIALGFAALAFARSASINYQTQYQKSVNSDIDKLKETLAFEYVYYDTNGNLHVYFINAGRISIQVDKLYLSTASAGIDPIISYMNGTAALNHALAVGEERQIAFQKSLTNGSYTVRIATIRGSSFEYTFNI